MKEKIGVLLILCCILLIGSVTASTLTIRPNSQGNYTDWSNVGCSAGSNEWNCVDENPANNSDYLYAYTSNNKESFGFEDIGLTSETIYGIELFYNAKRYSSTKYYFWPLFKISGIDFVTRIGIYCGSSYALKSQWVEKNPVTNNSWTVEDINNLEAGMKLLPYNYAGAYISQIYANVDYDAPGVYPDLNVSHLIFSEYNMGGNETNETYMQVYVFATVRNAGLDTVVESTTRLQGLSTEDRSTSMLRPTRTQSFYWNYNCTAPHDFTVTTDINGVVEESDETNNAKTVYIDCMI